MTRGSVCALSSRAPRIGGFACQRLVAIRLTDDASTLGGCGQAWHLPCETRFASALPRVGGNQRHVLCGSHRGCDLPGRCQLLS
jgi:hypothetical protein